MITAEKILIAILVPFLVMVAYIMLVMMPVLFYTDAECLRKGYPHSHVTIGLERYCSNFDGAVTVRVTKQ